MTTRTRIRAAGLILAMTSVFAVFSGIIWVIVTAWRAIIG